MLILRVSGVEDRDQEGLGCGCQEVRGRSWRKAGLDESSALDVVLQWLVTVEEGKKWEWCVLFGLKEDVVCRFASPCTCRLRSSTAIVFVFHATVECP